jgi:DNA helicase-2/ATP-dependent DNA helicase PcrA
MEDGIFPSQQNIGEEDEMSEERRLAYVAITRAKQMLYITHASERMMYGKTTYNQLSRFVKDEMPKSLIFEDSPRRREKPTFGGYHYGEGQQSFYRGGGNNSTAQRTRNDEFAEFRRPVEISTPKREKAGAAEYGITKFESGTRVRHDMFGEGTVISSRDMGGDVLYEVKFDNGQVKKLMATFAKLKKM